MSKNYACNDMNLGKLYNTPEMTAFYKTIIIIIAHRNHNNFITIFLVQFCVDWCINLKITKHKSLGAKFLHHFQLEMRKE